MSTEITGGEVYDYKGYDLVMASELPAPKVFLADRGYVPTASTTTSMRAAAPP